jgi:MYXO-CTERM domain-containing protein
MQAPKYMKRQERKVLSEGGTITWELEPNFGWLTVYSEPSGLDVTVNGTKAGRTPIERSEREPGVYRVLVTSPCHYDEGKKVKVIRGKEREVSVGLKEKQGAVSVKAKDSKGNDVAADMYIDGRKVGRTPGTYKVSVCAKEMEVRHRKLGSAKKALSIRERRVTEVEVQLEIQLESSHEEVRQPGKNLYWLRCPIGHTWTEYSCQGRRKKMNWHKSMKACPSGYRLPTKQEFVDLLGDCTWTRGMGGSRGKCNSCLAVGSACSSMFGYDNYSYWTSSSYKKDLPKRSSHPLAPTRSMDLGLTVDFATGYVRSAGKLSETNVRCVRLSLKKREVATISGEMKSVRSEDGGVKWMFSRPADIEFTKSEITVAQYRACIEEGKCTEPKSKSDHNYCNWGYSGRDNYPVNCVDWFQAVDFCTWAGGRLPTEDEWYAEASNKGSRKYPWGDQKATCNYAVMREVGGFGCGRNSTWPVCSKAKGNSVSGLCDMSGNVWEWTSSSKGHSRVIRGGGWRMDDEKAGCLLASFRDSADPTWGHRYGFRCGRGVASSEKPNQHYILGCASCSTAGDTGNQPFTIFMLLVLGILIRRRQLRID